MKYSRGGGGVILLELPRQLARRAADHGGRWRPSAALCRQCDPAQQVPCRRRGQSFETSAFGRRPLEFLPERVAPNLRAGPLILFLGEPIAMNAPDKLPA